MLISVRRLGVFAVALAATLAATTSAAQSQREYGHNAPFEVGDLPPGLLRSGLEKLPDEARSKALDWLHSFSFPAGDIPALRVDESGGVYYVDAPAEGTSTAPAPSSAAVPSVSEAFALHSKPGAARTIYVDFDGEVISGTAWNAGRADPLYARAFDTDGNPSSFSEAERTAIAEIWFRIAEDYAAFDVDVTTEHPGSFNAQTGHILVTETVDQYGNAMPAQNAGGVAYVNAWGGSNYPYYSPALVYADNLGPNHPPYIAEASSHEMGHNLGLSHDGTSTSGYYTGHGGGAVQWGPIMGASYYVNVSQWSKGEYADANNQQDDFAIITNKLTLSSDDHGDSSASSTLLSVAEDGSVSATTPEQDAFNSHPGNKGVIGTRADVDSFLITAGAGTIDLTITPSWAAWTRSSRRGTNLDIEATLYDESGSVLARSDPLNETDARINVAVAGGNYTLAIRGIGNANVPYSDYGSQGQYFISGSVPNSTPPPADTEAPTPNPMGWSSAPQATGPNSIAMTALTASDSSGGEVQYFFACVSGGAGCADSGWTSATTFTASGLDPQTTYNWQVKARDPSGNETSYSSSASATTADAPSVPTAPSAPTDLVAANGADGTARLTWTDTSDNETGFRVERESFHIKRNRWQSATEFLLPQADLTSWTDVSGTGTFRYRIQAQNAVGPSALTAWSEVTVTNASTGGGGCKGGPKKCSP